MRHAQIHISWPQYSVAETLVAVTFNQFGNNTNIPYIFRYCELLVLNNSHEKKLQIKNNSFTDCHAERLFDHEC